MIAIPRFRLGRCSNRPIGSAAGACGPQSIMTASPRFDRLWRSLRHPMGVRSLRAHVVVLVIACIVPMVAFSAFAVLRYANAQREDDNRQILSTAQALSGALDDELKTAEAALSALATSPSLRD